MATKSGTAAHANLLLRVIAIGSLLWRFADAVRPLLEDRKRQQKDDTLDRGLAALPKILLSRASFAGGSATMRPGDDSRTRRAGSAIRPAAGFPSAHMFPRTS